MGAAASIGAGGIKAFSDIEGAQGTKAADSAQADRLERAAQYGQIQATETSAQMRDRLNLTLGNIAAVRAAAHTDPTSPTGAALRDRTEDLGEQERTIRVGNILAQSDQDLADAAYARSAGSFAMKMGYVSAAGDALSALGGTNPSNFGAGNGTPPGVNPDSPAGQKLYADSIFP